MQREESRLNMNTASRLNWTMRGERGRENKGDSPGQETKRAE